MARFLILLFAFVGLTFAETYKQSLLNRLKVVETNLQNASVDYTRRGFDYFVEVLQKYKYRVEVHYKSVSALPDSADKEDAGQLARDVDEVEKNSPGLIKFPSSPELFKSGALYLATIREANKDSKVPTPEELRKLVVDIMIKEDYYDAVYASSEIAAQVAKAQIEKMYETLKGHLKNTKVPSPVDFKELEIEAKKQIADLTEKGKLSPVKLERAKKMQEALDRFMKSTFVMGKHYPLTSIHNYNLFILDAPRQYQDYKALHEQVYPATK